MCNRLVVQLFITVLVCGGRTSGQDTSPLFIRTLYSGVCREGTAVDTAILTVTAFDADPGPAGIIDYTLQENNLFKIDDRGAIRVKSPIDAENPDVGDVMTYIVTAADRGTPKRSGTTTLSIQIVDENEARPRFEKFLYFADVYQNDQIGTVILAPKAHDRDRDATLVYDMFISSPYFHIDNRTGAVMVDKAIDYKEVVEFYRGRSVFQVKARVTDGRYLSIVTIVTRVHTSERGLNNLLTTTQPPPTTTAPGCTIEGRRYTDGDRNPENNCEVCQMDVNPTSWTPTLIPLRAGGKDTCESICLHLLNNVPTYLNFACSFPFDVPLSLIHNICYVEDVDLLASIDCPDTTSTVSRLSAFCVYQDLQAARADPAVCP